VRTQWRSSGACSWSLSMVSLELLKDLGSLALVSGDDIGELFEQRLAHPVSSSLELLLGGDGINGLYEPFGRSEADNRA